MEETNQRIYQLSPDQLNIISSDLIEAIILIAGTQDKTGLLQELSNVNTNILITKEELEEKLKFIDNYLTKVSLIQKQVLGDKSIDKQYQLMTQKINKNFEDAIKKIESKIDEKEKIIDKKIENFKTDAEKIIETGKDGIKKDKDAIKKWMEQILETLDVNDISTHAKTLSTSAKDLKEAINEQNALKRGGIKPFLAGIFLSSIFFGIAIYLNSIMHFF